MCSQKVELELFSSQTWPFWISAGTALQAGAILGRFCPWWSPTGDGDGLAAPPAHPLVRSLTPGSYPHTGREGCTASYTAMALQTDQSLLLCCFFKKKNLFIKINKQCDVSEKNSRPISKNTSKPNSKLKQIQRG